MLGDEQIKKLGFFSISLSFLELNKTLTHDLYINSSGLPEKERFVRIFPKGELLDPTMLETLKNKYPQFYVPEEQREEYLNGLVHSESSSDQDKANFIKNSSINLLKGVFDKNSGLETGPDGELSVKAEMIKSCKESVTAITTVIKDYSISDLHQLIANLSFHDFYTFDHSINVSMYSIVIYKTLKLEMEKRVVQQEELTEVGLGALLHDLGKLKISTSIINNPGKLSTEEFLQIKQHPRYGLEMLQASSSKISGLMKLNIELVGKIIYEHHENFDGSGYPNAIKGEEISEIGKIVAIADFFDAITTKRSYSEVLSVDDAVGVMSKSVGKKLDPTLFDVFLHSIKKYSSGVKSKYELPSDFESSQPHEKLPLILSDDADEVYGCPDCAPIPKHLLGKDTGKSDVGKVVVEEKENDKSENSSQKKFGQIIVK